MVLAAVKIAFLAGLALTGSAPTPTADEQQNTALVGTRDTAPALPALEAAAPAAPSPQVSRPAPAAASPVTLPEHANGISSIQTSAVVEVSPLPAGAAGRGDDALQTALVRASSRSALSVQHVFGASVAQAADLPPIPEVAAPAPHIRPMTSPVAPERVTRPDEITPQAPPAPTVGPFVSPDSAARKQAELNRREQELLTLQQQMEARMSELHGLENRLQGMLRDADNAQDSKVKQLVDMYANMKPRQAAQALTSMDESIAVKILTGMKSKQSGEILSYMDPTHAARLSEVMSKMQM